jgi:hypothetical protein
MNLFDTMTEAEKTSDTGCTFQPGDRVSGKFTSDKTIGTVHGNRYFGAGMYGTLVLMDGATKARYIDTMHLRHAV